MYSLFWGLIYGPVIPKGGGLVKLNRPYLFQQKKASTMRPIYCDNSYLLVNLFRKYRLVSYSFIVTAYRGQSGQRAIDLAVPYHGIVVQNVF